MGAVRGVRRGPLTGRRPEGFADEEGRRHHSMDGWTCRVFNDSEAPIFEVSVEAIFDGGSTMLPVGELGPGSSSSIGTDEEMLVEEPMRRLRLELRFRDEAGRYWLETAMGGWCGPARRIEPSQAWSCGAG